MWLLQGGTVHICSQQARLCELPHIWSFLCVSTLLNPFWLQLRCNWNTRCHARWDPAVYVYLPCQCLKNSLINTLLINRNNTSYMIWTFCVSVWVQTDHHTRHESRTSWRSFGLDYFEFWWKKTFETASKEVITQRRPLTTRQEGYTCLNNCDVHATKAVKCPKILVGIKDKFSG